MKKKPNQPKNNTSNPICDFYKSWNKISIRLRLIKEKELNENRFDHIDINESWNNLIEKLKEQELWDKGEKNVRYNTFFFQKPNQSTTPLIIFNLN